MKQTSTNPTPALGRREPHAPLRHRSSSVASASAFSPWLVPSACFLFPCAFGWAAASSLPAAGCWPRLAAGRGLPVAGQRAQLRQARQPMPRAPGCWLVIPGSLAVWQLQAAGRWMLAAAAGRWLLAPGSWLGAPGRGLPGRQAAPARPGRRGRPGCWLLAAGGWLPSKEARQPGPLADGCYWTLAAGPAAPAGQSTASRQLSGTPSPGAIHV